MSDFFIGSSAASQPHKEGDIWTEQGKTWTIQNGIKRTVNKLDAVRKQQLVPLCCPQCGGTMKGSVNQIMWNIHRMCINCVVDMEHRILTKGEWDSYQKNKVLANANAFCKDMEGALQDYLNSSVSQARVTENGIVERWRDPSKVGLQQIADEEIRQLRDKIDQYEKQSSNSGKSNQKQP